MNNIGLYIHIPFCLSKCPYCDFYSLKFDCETAQRYKTVVIENLKSVSGIQFDTVYFGGGTPILLWREICEILSAIGDRITENAEITIEANPCCTSIDALCSLNHSGVNRASFGLQSGCDNELKMLGRRHDVKQGAKAVYNTEKAGFENISADIMLGVPLQNMASLDKTLQYMNSLPLTHISAYMLKIEPNTPFGKNTPILPDEDCVAELYLKTVDYLGQNGFEQYEISNFAKQGFESRHNLKYWRCEEYIGIGPSAHSFFAGKRYAVDRNLDEFLSSVPQKTYITDDSPAGYEEWSMLKLRLSEGLDFKTAEKRYGVTKSALLDKCRSIPKNLISIDDKKIRLTPEGFLVSNAVIGIISDI